MVGTNRDHADLGDATTQHAPSPGERRQRDLALPLDAFGRFEARGVLGAGGMGEVLEAWDPLLERTVAIKVVRHCSLAAEARLLDEAEAMARVEHPAVVRVFEVGRRGGTPYIVMEHLEGVTLTAWLQDPAAAPRLAPLALLTDVASGLQALHDVGLLHRDVKPSNMMWVPGRGGVLLDLGIAKYVHAASTPISTTEDRRPLSRDETEDGVLKGTPSYMSPEARRCEPLDVAADQWSLGQVAWRTLWPSLPPPATHRSNDNPRLWESVFPRGVVVRALRERTDERWPSVREFSRALTRAHTRSRLARWSALGLLVLGLLALLALRPPDSADAAGTATSAVGLVWGGQARVDVGAAAREQHDDVATATDNFEQALRLAQEAGSAVVEADAALGLANTSLLRNDLTAAERWFDHAASVGRRSSDGPAYDAVACSGRSRVLLRRGRYAEAQRTAERCLAELPPRADAPAWRDTTAVRLHSTLSELSASMGDIQRSAEHERRAFALLPADTPPRIRTGARMNLLRVEMLAAPSAALAAEAHDLASDWAETQGHDSLWYFAALHAARSQMKVEDLPAAAELLEQMVRAEVRDQEPAVFARAQVALGTTRCRQGRFEEALSWLHRGIEDGRALEGAHHPGAGASQITLATCLARMGQHAKAQALALKGVQQLEDMGLMSGGDRAREVHAALAKIYALDPTQTSEARRRLALLHADENLREEAATEVRELLAALDPNGAVSPPPRNPRFPWIRQSVARLIKQRANPPRPPRKAPTTDSATVGANPG